MWYVPHICLQNVLRSLDNASSKQSAYAWAALLVFSRVANLLVHITKMNMCVPRTAQVNFLLHC